MTERHVTRVVINEDAHSRRVMLAADFLAQHRDHIITGTGPVGDGDCIINVRVCATCSRMHVAHNDEVREAPERSEA